MSGHGGPAEQRSSPTAIIRRDGVDPASPGDAVLTLLRLGVAALLLALGRERR